MTDLVLYLCPGTSSMAVHIALHEIGTPFRTEVLELQKGTRTPEYLKINPNGRVPAMLIDGRPLIEVAGCLFYLAKAFPQAKLLPANDPETEAQAVAWMSFIASTVHPARAKGLEAAMEAWTTADTMLGSREWALGSAYSIADIHLFRVFWRQLPGLEAPADKFANLRRHYATMMARPAVKKTLEVEQKLGLKLPA
jgi:glutathione S-transferase